MYQLRIIAIAIASTLLPLTAGAGQGPGLSKKDVKAVLMSIDTALLKKDANAVIANFASNAVITATVFEDGRTTQTEYDLSSSYGIVLAAGFQSFSDYKLTRKDVVIKISTDGRTARTTSKLTETFVFGGDSERAVTDESATLQAFDGKVLVTKMHDEVVVE